MLPQAEMRAAVFLAMEEQDNLEVILCSLNMLQTEVPLTQYFILSEKNTCHQREPEEVSQHQRWSVHMLVMVK